MELHQNIAVTKGVRSRAERALTDAYHLLQKPEPLTGISRRYQPRAEDGETLPGESVRVQVRVTDVITQVTEAMRDMFDVAATGEWGNCTAKADLVVDGDVLLTDVPVTYLLFLEKRLVDLTTFIRKLPVLSPAEEWSYDETTDAYRTPEVLTTRGKKVPRTLEKAKATERHPAQVEVWMEDVVVGDWHTVRYSGALPQARVNELLSRARRLTDAVLRAREQANSIEVARRQTGETIMTYLFG